MPQLTRGAALGAAAACLALGPTACAQQDEADHPTGGPVIGVLMPDDLNARWEGFDRPLIEERIGEVCLRCAVRHANGQNDVATQQQQVESMITNHVDALILAPVDAMAVRSVVERAHAAGIPVVAYDRLAEGPISGYSSFDGVEVGRLQGQALLRALRARGPGRTIVMMNGSPIDPNSAQFERGARSVLEGEADIAKAYDVFNWDPANANINMTGAIADIGARRIDGVYAAADSLAAAVIAALRAANLDPIPPVTGQDADLAAVQRIVEGEQYMTVYKAFPLEARPAADMAVALARGEGLEGIAGEMVRNGSGRDIPAVLARPEPVTVDTIDDTLLKNDVYTIEKICTPRYRSACRRAGLV